MRNHFLVKTKPISSLGAAVFAAGALSPMDMLDDIEKDLRKRRVTGKVIFDLLLAHGNKVNRFFWAEFDGKHFQTSRFQTAGEDYAQLSQFSAKFLKEHVEEVDVSLLSKAMRYAVEKGIPL